MDKRFFNALKEFIVMVTIAFVLAFGIRTALAEPRLVPSGSMEPTIAIGDRLITVKALYYFKQPERGDIVVFNVPKQLNLPSDTPPFVKRLIGLPGDTVEIRNGIVYVNGKVFNVDAARVPNYSYGPVKVEDGTVFVLGDNRNNSLDSHAWGFLPEENIIAKAVCVYWPPGRIQILK